MDKKKCIIQVMYFYFLLLANKKVNSKTRDIRRRGVVDIFPRLKTRLLYVR